MIHLDADIVVAWLRGDEQAEAFIESRLPDVALSTVVLAEVLYGVNCSNRPRENRKCTGSA
jgi:predicted nucleic acid-binding protein